MKVDPFANLAAAPGERALSREANGRIPRGDRRLVAQLREMLHFACERVAPAECVRIDQLQEN